jgi:hypothetical protein
VPLFLFSEINFRISVRRLNICLSVPGLFHLTWSPPDPQVTGFNYFLWLHNILLCVHYIFYIHHLVTLIDILSAVNNAEINTWVQMSVQHAISIPLDMCPVIELVGHMVVLLFAVWGTPIWFLLMSSLIHLNQLYRRGPLFLLSVSGLPFCYTQEMNDLLSITVDFCFLGFYIKRIIEYVLFLVCLISFT